MKSPIDLLSSLLASARRFDPCVKGLDRDIITLERRYEYEGYGFLAIALPALGSSLDQGLSLGRFSCPSHFSKMRDSALPKLFSGLLSNVFDPKSGLLKDDANTSVVKSLRRICYAFKKVSLEKKNSDKLDFDAKRDFFENDRRISTLYKLTSRDENHISHVTSFILSDLREFDMSSHEDIVCRHGPGAVAENLKTNQKWLDLWTKISSGLSQTIDIGYDIFGLSDNRVLSTRLSTDSVTDAVEAQQSIPSGCIARLISVPKNSTSRRTITIEPCEKQFIQQGYNKILRDSISRCFILRNCLALTSQHENQVLALEGSLSDTWATIDLKSASDLLSSRLVSLVFKHFPLFLEGLFNCRSQYVTDGKTSYHIEKYAGMGNATTFPVQSVVFAVLAIAAIVDDGSSLPSFRKLRRASRCVRVFGDDIIIKTEYAHTVVSWLSNAGLIVNIQKSFLNGNFKESCGVDAFRGVDVTPRYVRHRPELPSSEANDIAGLVSLSNLFWIDGEYEPSELLRATVEKRLGISLPLVSRNSSSLGWHSRIDAMDQHGWDNRLQQPYTKGVVLSSPKRKDKIDGYAALLKFFHVPLVGRPLDHLQKTSVRFKLRISRKRVPTKVG